MAWHRDINIIPFSSGLILFPDLNKVVSEVACVLEPSGRCVLDFGNSRSLNTYCVSKYTELPPSLHLPLPTILKMLSENGLSVVEHRAFQILPLWATGPAGFGRSSIRNGKN